MDPYARQNHNKESITLESFACSLFNKSLLYDTINPLTVF